MEMMISKTLLNATILILLCVQHPALLALKATHIAATTGKKILLANKESIVAGGDLILPLAKENNTEIIPIDSEHNAIFQCLIWR
jgi:1-deoxy-D-xylulose-5-phosphate reductoisomerase